MITLMKHTILNRAGLPAKAVPFERPGHGWDIMFLDRDDKGPQTVPGLDLPRVEELIRVGKARNCWDG